jgi:hypothetical protein
MNGLLRDYFPKGTDLNAHSPQHLLAVENELNSRPCAEVQAEFDDAAVARMPLSVGSGVAQDRRERVDRGVSTG